MRLIIGTLSILITAYYNNYHDYGLRDCIDNNNYYYNYAALSSHQLTNSNYSAHLVQRRARPRIPPVFQDH